MLKSEVVLSGFGAVAPEKYPPQLQSVRMPRRTKHSAGIRPRASRFACRSSRAMRPSRAEICLQKRDARWIVHDAAKEQRFQVIDDEGGVIDTWRLRASIARFERGEGERVDLDAIRERFGLTPGK